MEEKKEKKPKKRKSRVKNFLLRTALSALVFATLFLLKTYKPETVSYVKREIDYSMDFTYLQNKAQDFIMKFTPYNFYR